MNQNAEDVDQKQRKVEEDNSCTTRKILAKGICVQKGNSINREKLALKEQLRS